MGPKHCWASQQWHPAKADGDADNDQDVDADDLAEWDAALGQGALPLMAVSADANGLVSALLLGGDDDEEDFVDAVFGRWS